jgi:hypothetical protein
VIEEAGPMNDGEWMTLGEIAKRWLDKAARHKEAAEEIENGEDGERSMHLLEAQTLVACAEELLGTFKPAREVERF